MTEGINMGRKSPWSKEEYISVYNQVSQYAIRLCAKLLLQEGAKFASEANMMYIYYKCPAIYLFIHYHYGRFENLRMSNDEQAAYLTMFLPNVKYFANELKKAYATGQVFINDNNNYELSSKLLEMCEEIIYIEDNF